MLKFKGEYSGSTDYSVGDVVIYTDNLVYHMHTDAAAGTPCHDTRHWQQLDGVLTEAVRMMNDAMTAAVTKAGTNLTSKLKNNLTTTASGYALDARQGKTLDDAIKAIQPNSKTLKLASSTEASTKVFNITVDDDGELTATEVT